MGLFAKKNVVCNICGGSVGLGSKAIADGYICNKCYSKKSPEFEFCSDLTTDDFREHLEYREENLENLKQFRPTKIWFAPRNEEEYVDGGKIYVDENRKEFLFSEQNDYVKRNVNLFKYSDFKCFVYTLEKSYIMIKVMAFSRACNSIIEHEIEWDVYIPEEFDRKPQKSPQFKEAVEIVQKAEKFFNAMLEKPISKPVAPSEPVCFYNVSCPSCGALTTTSEPTATCNYCGLTFANNFFRSKEVHAPTDKKSVVENLATPDDENTQENKPAADKSKAGKVALKVALGVMTGGVSLIPDAVNAVKKKDKENEN